MFAFEAQDIRKSYGGVKALDGAGISIKPGTVHALLGENGAGKSTLVKIMTGAVKPDAGILRLNGQAVSYSTTAEALSSGVAIVSQELSLFPHLSVLANMFPMREPRRGIFINKKKMAELAAPILSDLGASFRIDALVQDLTLADRQLVEIAKALVSNPKVLLLDEPTSALEGQTTKRLLNILKVLKSRKVAVVFVSHILQEVMDVCDEVTVLRDGKLVVNGEPISNHSISSIVAAMIGEKKVVRRSAGMGDTSTPRSTGTKFLSVENLVLGRQAQPISFVATQGEILGLVGLAGAGQNRVLKAIASIQTHSKGKIVLPSGKQVPKTQRKAIEAGIAFVTGDRKRFGLMLKNPVWENIVQVTAIGLGNDGLYLRKRALVKRAEVLIKRVGIKVASAESTAGSLSGGNQQKVVLAKWLDLEPKIILMDEPTRGVDVVARSEIHGILHDAAKEGATVLISSNDLEEISEVCDRVLVFKRGVIVSELQGEEISLKNMLTHMN